AAILIAAQVGLAVLLVAASTFLTRKLHDCVPSTIRAGVASGVGTLTWIVFFPFALVFGAVSDRAGVHTAGWIIVTVTAVTCVALVTVALTHRTPHRTTHRTSPVRCLRADLAEDALTLANAVS